MTMLTWIALRALCVICVIITVARTKIHVSDDELCLPLLPTPSKIRTLNKFRNNTAPLYFWHLQKAAGSSFCMMMRMEYKTHNETITNISPDCNSHRFQQDLVLNFSQWSSTYQPQNYLFVASEPSNADFKTFPLKYHADGTTQILLNKTYGSRRDLAWTNMVHVLVIRHPIDMAISAFNYKFPGTEKSINTICEDHKISTDNCMREALSIKENSNISTHKLFNSQQLNRIRTEILGNYMLSTFTLDENMMDAKHLLSRFSLIVDISLSSITSSLVTCVLGWSNVKKTVRNNVNKAHPTVDLFRRLTTETLKRMSFHLKYDIALYDYALSLSIQHHAAMLNELYPSSWHP